MAGKAVYRHRALPCHGGARRIPYRQEVQHEVNSSCVLGENVPARGSGKSPRLAALIFLGGRVRALSDALVTVAAVMGNVLRVRLGANVPVTLVDDRSTVTSAQLRATTRPQGI